MRTNYGDDLELVRGYDEDLVVTLMQCSQLMVRFWSTVFGQYFPKGSVEKSSIDSFDDLPKDLHDLRSFLDHWEIVLKSLYIREMDNRQNQALLILIDRWNEMTYK